MTDPEKSTFGDPLPQAHVKSVHRGRRAAAPKSMRYGTPMAAQPPELNVAPQQNRIQEGMKMSGKEAADAFVDAAGFGMRRLIEAQKGVLDLAVQQANTTLKAVQEQAEHATAAVPPAMAQMVQLGVNWMVSSQKALLELAAQQGALAIETVKGVGADEPARIADTYKKAIDNTVEAQKKLIDLVIEPLKAKTAGHGE